LPLFLHSTLAQVTDMRNALLSIFSFYLAVNVVSAQPALNQQYPLPKSHVWESKGMQVCKAVGTVGIRQAKDTPAPSEEFLVEAGRGAHRLEITVGDKDLLVSVDGAEPQKYKIMAETVGVLTAVLIGDVEPTISSISVDKVTSYVVWSTTEPRDFTRDVPRHTAALLVCTPGQH
jgi:hypothetical protein